MLIDNYMEIGVNMRNINFLRLNYNPNLKLYDTQKIKTTDLSVSY